MSDDLDGYRPLRLRPWDNLFRQIDPAERFVTCSTCGEDFDPTAPRRSDGWRCACFPSEAAS